MTQKNQPTAPLTEAQLQANCYQWLHNTYPELRGFFFAVPNGGARHAREAVLLKATGTVPGVPDCLLIWPAFVAIEFKTEQGALSTVQKELHLKWAKNGLRVEVVRSVERFQSVIKQVMSEHYCLDTF